MKMILWSEMTGKVLIANKPAANAVIKRHYRWHWKNRHGDDTTTTRSDGTFVLPTISRFAWLGFLPHEPVIEQMMTVEYEGNEYDV